MRLGAFFGLTAGVQPEHMVRAVLEAIAYQVKEIVIAINASSNTVIEELAVDGGMSENNFLLQFQADVLEIAVKRPAMRDTTVQGVAFAAGLAVGFWDDYQALVQGRIIDRCFSPSALNNNAADFATWLDALAMQFLQYGGGLSLLLGLMTALLLFSSVVAHELGHSFIAIRARN
ncbi:glycerol kinase [Tolypothrix sp. NIES-4075]|nr:glycerol kinase [Tolypothrix sp. NIES-4075]